MPTAAEIRGTVTKTGLFPTRRVVRQAGIASLASLLLCLSFSGACAQPQTASSPPAPPESLYTYADVADLATRADMIAIARPKSFAKLAPEVAGTPPGTQRYFVDAQVDSLIRGEAGLPPRIGFLIDLPAELKTGRAMKGRSFLLFGKAGARPGDFQLLSSKAILPADTGTVALVRKITTELLARDAPPEIVRVVEAFHVEGTVAGESETQIFLATRSGTPVSLSVIRRPEMEARFGAALGEIVDEAAALPQPDTLLWYRLSCGLPRALPQGAAMKLDAQSAPAAAADYRAFMDRLAPCARTRPPALGKPGIGG